MATLRPGEVSSQNEAKSLTVRMRKTSFTHNAYAASARRCEQTWNKQIQDTAQRTNLGHGATHGHTWRTHLGRIA